MVMDPLLLWCIIPAQASSNFQKKSIEELRQKLEFVDGYLRDIDEVERLPTHDRVFQAKVQQLRRTLVEIEDFLDTVIDLKQQPAVPPKFFKKLKAFLSCASNPVIQKHRFAVKITELIEALGGAEDYKLPNDKVPKTKLRSSPGIIDHEIIIGLEEDVGDLIANFVGKEGECGANSAIVGMGGSGKTTLARKFYDHEEIKKVFPRRAWVCVSQQWDTHELLLQICKELGVSLSGDDERSIPILQRKLTEFLRHEGSCLVILDDVWERAALDDFLHPLLGGNCRVLITTRKKHIFHFPNIRPFHVHVMRGLTKKQSRELFSKIICNNGIVNVKFIEEESEGVEDEFAKLGREMLEKCEGLPIAIITLAGLLGTKDTIQDWESIKNNVISIIMKDENNAPLGYETVKKVLEFSYSDLSYDLKSCFLYLGAFKEDGKIGVDPLINLWIDEGFMKPDQHSERRRLKEAAKDSMKELVQRCMVQVVSRDYNTGDISEIRIHDLM